MLNFLWFALGLGALLVALALCALILRLIRTLGALEASLLMVDEAVREMVPELKSTLGNVNGIASGLNVAVRGASLGAARLTEAVDLGLGRASRQLRATAHGAGVTARSLLRALHIGNEGGGDVEG
ncbi:MAG TPA: hypothetical protein VMU49_05655 [Candidatus Acidoferrales bacterium]|nr:hypothetical protein [Candidatus Acidoferrales bacterium]